MRQNDEKIEEKSKTICEIVSSESESANCNFHFENDLRKKKVVLDFARKSKLFA